MIYSMYGMFTTISLLKRESNGKQLPPPLYYTLTLDDFYYNL